MQARPTCRVESRARSRWNTEQNSITYKARQKLFNTSLEDANENVFNATRKGTFLSNFSSIFRPYKAKSLSEKCRELITEVIPYHLDEKFQFFTGLEIRPLVRRANSYAQVSTIESKRFHYANFPPFWDPPLLKLPSMYAKSVSRPSRAELSRISSILAGEYDSYS